MRFLSMNRAHVRWARWGTLPLAAFALVACETTGAGDATGGPSQAPGIDTSPLIGAPPDADPAIIEEEIDYTTEVDRFPQRDGSILVVTTVRGSDGSVFIDEEVIRPNAPATGSPSRGISTPGRGPASNVPDGSETTTADEAASDPFADAEDDVDVSLGDVLADIEPRAGEAASCDPTALAFDFDWPPPEPSARIEIPRALVMGGLGEGGASVNRIQIRVQNALESAGYLDQAFYTIGCDGFAIITRMEQIDRNGRPLAEGVRFTTPGDTEQWSLSGYLTRLFYAPPGFYRQIILAGTDEVYDPNALADAPDEDDLQAVFTAGSGTRLDIAPGEDWGAGHKLHALIYEFETQGTRNVKQRRPSPIPAERHVVEAGIYQDLDE
ncbi:MAG: hypothetical protein AAF253_02535 [Pseudomonadota bacterium]